MYGIIAFFTLRLQLPILQPLHTMAGYILTRETAQACSMRRWAAGLEGARGKIEKNE